MRAQCFFILQTCIHLSGFLKGLPLPNFLWQVWGEVICAFESRVRTSGWEISRNCRDLCEIPLSSVMVQLVQRTPWRPSFWGGTCIHVLNLLRHSCTQRQQRETQKESHEICLLTLSSPVDRVGKSSTSHGDVQLTLHHYNSQTLTPWYYFHNNCICYHSGCFSQPFLCSVRKQILWEDNSELLLKDILDASLDTLFRKQTIWWQCEV